MPVSVSVGVHLDNALPAEIQQLTEEFNTLKEQIIYYRMVMRIKDCGEENDPFEKYEYKTADDVMENIGIRIVKSLAEEVKYSFIYGVNFITITV